MKKDLKSKSRKKWIVGGVALFAGIALLTTGFATWIIGVNQNKNDINTDVEVEGTVNESLKLTTSLTESKIVVSEQHTKGSDELIGTQDNSPATDFDVTCDFTIEVGKSFLSHNDLTTLSFAFKDTTVAQKVTSSADAFAGRTASTEYTYIDINDTATITIPTTDGNGWTIVDGGSSYTYEYKGTITLFKWGTFFNNSTPCTFYNAQYTAGTINNSDTDINKVLNEMRAMQTALNGTTLTIEVTANTTSK